MTKSVTTVVPVTCSECSADMAFTVTTFNEQRRHWSLDCPSCGYQEQQQHQRREHLWMNDETIYVGSYWTAV